MCLISSINLRYSSHNKPLNDATLLVVEQRLRRPVSPHLSIYRPQITWVPSMLTRITGIALSGGLYLYSTAYLVSPVTGWDIGSESLVAAFSNLPPWAQIAVKLGIALPFVFHSFNGVRILVWDTGRMYTNRQVNWGGWMVVGSSGVCALLLALWKSDNDA
ncbi:Succinate dehydrogenase cytochrome b556 subunit [Penicillium sp. IBT 35674x]|nr:Succinate dehydrogenase cytochrome b556 subunit [Penicillium sp. IBT 35674x]